MAVFNPNANGIATQFIEIYLFYCQRIRKADELARVMIRIVWKTCYCSHICKAPVRGMNAVSARAVQKHGEIATAFIDAIKHGDIMCSRSHEVNL